jgi:FkbM family methyltransferase
LHPFNRILNVIGLRVIRVEPPGPPPGTTSLLKVGGFEIKAPVDDPLYESYAAHPGYNSEIGRMASAICSRYPDMMAVDVGANIGDTAAIIRGACPAPIVCVEGDRALAGILAENVAQLGDVRLVHCYLDERREERPVNIAKAGWNSTLAPAVADAPGAVVAFSTLDDVIDDADHARIKLLKVDTEGYEKRVLRGARNLLRDGRPAVLFEHNRDALSCIEEDGTEIFSELRDLGYRSTLFWDNTGRFLLGTSLNETGMIADLHDYVAYAGRSLGCIYYLDVCAFHEDDGNLAEQCLTAERVHRHALAIG